jgi:tetratricopeptide (TPR) repeat protein
MRWFAILIVILVLVPTASSAQQRWTWPEKTKNMKVFPQNPGPEALRSIMTGFTRALGVRCSYCHVGEEGQPLSEFDFVSDENANKDRAREMIRMLQDIQLHLDKLDRSGPKKVEVGCATCHRGVAKPMKLEDVLIAAWKADGAAAAMEQYDELRDRYYGRGAYDFGEASLNAVGYAMLEAGDLDDAVSVLERNRDLFPDSFNAWDSLGEAHMKAGHTEEAIECLQKSLELEPRNRHATQLLEELRGG